MFKRKKNTLCLIVRAVECPQTFPFALCATVGRLHSHYDSSGSLAVVLINLFQFAVFIISSYRPAIEGL